MEEHMSDKELPDIDECVVVDEVGRPDSPPPCKRRRSISPGSQIWDEDDMELSDIDECVVVDEIQSIDSPPDCKKLRGITSVRPICTENFVGSSYNSTLASGNITQQPVSHPCPVLRPSSSSAVPPTKPSGSSTSLSTSQLTKSNGSSTSQLTKRKGRSRNQKKPCVIKECTVKDRNLRRHSQVHLPLRFRTKSWEDQDLHGARMEGIHWLCFRVTGSDDLSSLMVWVQALPEFPENAVIIDHEVMHMEELCLQEGWSIPTEGFSFYPINSPAVLFHWRILCTILAFLKPQDRTDFYELDRPIPKEKEKEEEEVVAEKSIVMTANLSEREAKAEETVMAATCSTMDSEQPKLNQPNPQPRVKVTTGAICLAIDSHFHLDQCRNAITSLNPWSSVEDLISSNVNVQPDHPVQVTGGVVVWSDPVTYPQVLPTLPPGFRSAVGFHPKNVREFTEESIRHMKRLYLDEGCAALGEIGLDYSAHCDTWIRQEAMLKKILPFSMLARPVVFYAREGNNTPDPYEKLLRIAKDFLHPRQSIHLHCFTGGSKESFTWLDSFPNCRFGITALAQGFSDHQQQAIKGLDLNQLLLETDSPCQSRSGQQFRNTPAFIGDVAEIVANIRSESGTEILAAASRNAKELYNL